MRETALLGHYAMAREMWQRVNANFDCDEAQVAIEIFVKARRERRWDITQSMAKVKLGPELD